MTTYPPPFVPAKVTHTKGWAIGWGVAFGCMTIIATFWLVMFAGVDTSFHCGTATHWDTNTATSAYEYACVRPSDHSATVLP